MNAYLLTPRKHTKNYICRLKWKEGNHWESKDVNTNVPVKGNNKRKAEQKCEELRQQYEEKYEVYKANTDDILFSEYMLEWLKDYRYNVRQSTFDGYTNNVENHIVPFFKDLGISLYELKPQHIQKFYTYLMDNGLSANSVKRHHANIRKALQDAYMQGRIPANPADRVRLPKVEKFHAKILSKEQLGQLLGKIKGHPIEPAVRLAAYYGLRRSEVCGLEWKNVDFENGVIHITKTRTAKAHEIIEDKTKSESSRRDLPLIPTVREYLLELKVKQEANRKFMGNRYYDSDFVCVWDNGKPLGCNYISKHFKNFVKKLGCEGVTFHSLRHTAGTMMSNSGAVSLKTVQEFLGHSDIATTQIYLHPDFTQYIKAADVMENSLR